MVVGAVEHDVDEIALVGLHLEAHVLEQFALDHQEAALAHRAAIFGCSCPASFRRAIMARVFSARGKLFCRIALAASCS